MHDRRAIMNVFTSAARPLTRPLALFPRPLRRLPIHLGVARISARHVRQVTTAGAHNLQDAPAQNSQGQEERGRPGKRKVALYLGYEGTGYKGLQRNTSTAPDATIEDTLERAIFRAGGILESNLGALGKLRWGRSSRTDKSVHSLATVISLKLECDPESFVADPEGLGLAERINAHLPPEMRVFCVQRVSKSFSARAECIRRSYNYYLPASVLGLRLDGGAEDAVRLEALAQCWEAFQGTHPFHNYTKRRLYRDEAVFGGGGAARRRKGRQEASAADAEEEEEGGSEGDPSAWESDLDAPSEGAGASSSSASGSAGAPAGHVGGNGSSSGGGDGAAARRERNKIEVRWTDQRDERDPVVRRHYRFMEWCRAGEEVVTLVPGGTPCIQLSLCGTSFMLHQIRKMVAASVAVARGQLPRELVAASLAAPARVALPLAPPLTLVLAGAQFAPFRKSWDSRAAAAAVTTGERLELRAGGAAAQQHFWEQTLRPAVDQLLAAEEWGEWERDLGRLWLEEAEVQEVVRRHAEWRGAQAQRKEARLGAMLEEAQALENRGEGC